MKKLCFSMLFILFIATTYAQTPFFVKGKTAINVGVGIGDRGLPMEASAIYGIVDNLFRVNGLNLGIGGYFGLNYWESSKISIHGGFGVLFGVSGEVHYSFVKNLDFFGGLMCGVEFDKWEGTLPSGSTNGKKISISVPYVGAKYFFNDNFGIYSSIGYGITHLSAGIALQF